MRWRRLWDATTFQMRHFFQILRRFGKS